MALVLKDRVRAQSIVVGTGDITFSSTVVGYQDFSVIGNGNTTYYTITDGTQWEVGIGTYTTSTNTLSRDTVISSSNSGNKVVFTAGAKDVFVTYPAEKSVNGDATGSVGIGTPTPTAKLDVAGTAKLGASGTDTITLTGEVSANASTGLSGQLLASRGTGLSPQWVTPGSGSVSAITVSPIPSYGLYLTGGTITTTGTIGITGSLDLSGYSGNFGAINITNLGVTGTSNLGAIGNITITGGSSNQVLQTNGSGSLSFDYPYATAANIATVNANYTITTADRGKILECTSLSADINITLPNVSTLLAGFQFTIWNTNQYAANYTVTIKVPTGSGEYIDGKSTLVLYRGEGTQVICNGSQWYSNYQRRLKGYAESFDESIFATPARPIASGDWSIAMGASSDASGNYSSVLGGLNGTASGTYSTAAGGQASSATGNWSSVFGGYSGSATGSYSAILGGNDNTAGTASGAVAIGGASNIASGKYSYAIGFGARARETGKWAHGCANNSTNMQSGHMVLGASTTNATATFLASDDTGTTAANNIVAQSYSAIAFSGLISAKQQGTSTNTAAWKFEGLIRRENAASTTTLVTSTVTAISNAPAWTDPSFSADTSTGALRISVTGVATTNIRWVASINTAEVIYT